MILSLLLATALTDWSLRGSARMMTDADGVPYAFVEEESAVYGLFPVEPGTTLEVTLRAKAQRYLRGTRHPPWLAVSFYATEEEGRAPNAAWSFVRPKLELPPLRLARGRGICEKTETYPVPKTARWCRLVFRGGNLYGCDVKVK